jgi:hypothetical protein
MLLTHCVSWMFGGYVAPCVEAATGQLGLAASVVVYRPGRAGWGE